MSDVMKHELNKPLILSFRYFFRIYILERETNQRIIVQVHHEASNQRTD